MANNDNFWVPKSIFKGRTASGEKVTFKEWDANSIGNLGGDGAFSLLSGIIFAIFFLAIASPLCLIFAILTYDGRVGVTNIIGILASIYFWVDLNNSWVFSDFSHIIISDSTMMFLLAINIASLMAHVGLLVMTIIFNVEFNVFPKMWVLTIFVGIMFFMGYKIGVIKTNNHGTYNPEIIEPIDPNSREGLELQRDEYFKTHTIDETYEWEKQHGLQRI